LIIKGRSICKGKAIGEALVSKNSLSFYGGVNPNTGIIIEKGHELEGECIKDKILIFKSGKGSTVGSYVLYQLAKNKVAPKAIVNVETEPIIAAGCILADIPLIDKLEIDPTSIIKTGDIVEVNGDKGYIKIHINTAVRNPSIC